MDMWIPFEIPAKSMENHDKSRRKIFGFIHLEKHVRDNTCNCMKKAVKEGAVFKEKITKVFINGEDTMPVLYIYEFKRHRCSAFHAVFVSACRTKTTVTTERNKLKVSTVRTMVHGTAKSRVATVDHLIDIFHFSISWMESVFNFFIVVGKNPLQDINKTIMKDDLKKRNPLTPQD